MALHPSDLSDLSSLLTDTRSSLESKTILLTGSSGLIGGYLLECLLNIAEYSALRFSLILTTRQQFPPQPASPSNLAISYIYCDFADPISVHSLVLKYFSTVDIVFHCASPSSPKAYTSQPFSTFAANSTSLQYLLSTLNYSDSSFSPKFFFFSTTGVYGRHPPQDYPLDEFSQCHLVSTDLGSIYNVSKIAGEQILSHAAHIHGICLYILRLNINYGPGINLNDGRALSDFLNDARSGSDVRLRSLGAQTRNYLYLSDTIAAIFMLLNQVHSSCTVNLSHHVDISIRELARCIAHLYGVKIILPDCSVTHSGIDFDQTSVDCSLLQRLTGWFPTISLHEGLERLINTLDTFGSTL